MSSANNVASRSQLEFAFSYLEEEHETLLALAMALLRQVEPVDPDAPNDAVDTTAWRLAQVLEQRLGSTVFVADMRKLIFGEV
jgi:hypothetical protein